VTAAPAPVEPDRPSKAPPVPPPGQELVVGLLAAPGLAHDLAEQLAQGLPAILEERFPGVRWRTVAAVESLAGAAGIGEDLVQVARRRMLSEGWNAVICLTDLPLHVGRRPVTAHGSLSLGVGLVSVPALGAVALESRVRETVVRLIEGLLGERLRDRHRHSRRLGIRSVLSWRLRSLAYPVGHAEVQDGEIVRFVGGGVRGNVRLVVGMVRANRPWRLVAGLSRALVAALGTAAFTLTSPGVWRIANGMGWVRLVLVATGAIVGTCVLLIAVHRLWEHSPHPAARDRVLLFNIATALTLGLGVLTHFVLLLVIATVCGFAIVAPAVLAAEVHHAVGLGDYLRLAFLVSSLATVGGALGAAIESDAAVREAAYGYQPDQRD
jgi:hypothetical protein